MDGTVSTIEINARSAAVEVYKKIISKFIISVRSVLRYRQTR